MNIATTKTGTPVMATNFVEIAITAKLKVAAAEIVDRLVAPLVSADREHQYLLLLMQQVLLTIHECIVCYKLLTARQHCRYTPTS